MKPHPRGFEWGLAHHRLHAPSQFRGVKKLCNEDFEGRGLGLLSIREREVALAVVDGISMERIANQLGFSVNTISTLTSRAGKKIGVLNGVELTARLKDHDVPVPVNSWVRFVRREGRDQTLNRKCTTSPS